MTRLWSSTLQKPMLESYNFLATSEALEQFLEPDVGEVVATLVFYHLVSLVISWVLASSAWHFVMRDVMTKPSFLLRASSAFSVALLAAPSPKLDLLIARALLASDLAELAASPFLRHRARLGMARAEALERCDLCSAAALWAAEQT